MTHDLSQTVAYPPICGDFNTAMAAILARAPNLEPAAYKRVLPVAVSGGSDSVALLLLASGWAKAQGWSLVGLTVDHRTRPEAAAEAQAVAALCARLGWLHRTLTLQNTPEAGLKSAELRQHRHVLLAEATRDCGAQLCLLGHTQDDAYETLLMRAQAAADNPFRFPPLSPSPVWPQGRGIWLARPLLSQSRAGLQDWLRKQGYNWIDDPGNADLVSARIRARRALAVDPSVRDGLLRRWLVAEQRQTESRLAGLEALRQVNWLACGGVNLPLSALAEVPFEVAAQVFEAVCVAVGGSLRTGQKGRAGSLLARLVAARAGLRACFLGCLVQRLGDCLTYHRDPGGVQGMAPQPVSPVLQWPDWASVPPEVVWDRRILVRFAQADPAVTDSLTTKGPISLLHSGAFGGRSLQGLEPDLRALLCELGPFGRQTQVLVCAAGHPIAAPAVGWYAQGVWGGWTRPPITLEALAPARLQALLSP